MDRRQGQKELWLDFGTEVQIPRGQARGGGDLGDGKIWVGGGEGGWERMRYWMRLADELSNGPKCSRIQIPKATVFFPPTAGVNRVQRTSLEGATSSSLSRTNRAARITKALRYGRQKHCAMSIDSCGSADQRFCFVVLIYVRYLTTG